MYKACSTHLHCVRAVFKSKKKSTPASRSVFRGCNAARRRARTRIGRVAIRVAHGVPHGEHVANPSGGVTSGIGHYREELLALGERHLGLERALAIGEARDGYIERPGRSEFLYNTSTQYSETCGAIRTGARVSW